MSGAVRPATYLPKGAKRRPTWQEMERAIEWLRKNDVDDADGRACQTVADVLQVRVDNVKAKQAHRAALLALEEGRMRR